MQGSPSLLNAIPHGHPLAPSVSAWFSFNLSVPALYSWNTLTAEPFISHPRCSSHTWHTWWALKGAAAMWGWFALHLVPPHPYQCPIYLYSYNPDLLMRHPQMSGQALSCLLLTSSGSQICEGISEYSADPLKFFWCFLIFVCLPWSINQSLAHCGLLAKRKQFFSEHLCRFFILIYFK